MHRLTPLLFLFPALLTAQSSLPQDAEAYAAADIPVYRSVDISTTGSADTDGRNDPKNGKDAETTEDSDDTEAADGADDAPVMRKMPVISFELEDIIQNLQDSPANLDRHRRKIDAKKLEDWVKRSPEVGLELSDNIMPYLQYGEARTLFTCGFVQYSVAHPVFNPDAAYVAGIRSVISYYKDNRDVLGSDELLDKLVKLKEKGRLSGFIKRRLN